MLAWGIVRGANEADTLVDVRIIVDPVVYSSLIGVGSDPFTQHQKLLLSAPPKAGRFDLRVPRAQFAEFPRTELRFFSSTPSNATDSPKLVVFYLGVPDTTPEFASDAALDAYLGERFARMRANTGGKGKTP